MNTLTAIQGKLKAPKNRKNSFGGYSYRSCEDILEVLKPILAEYDATMTISDQIIMVGTRVYVQATVTLRTKDGDYTATALAREAETKKGMDDSQITGTASSYARKYALNGLLLIDDTKDADTDEFQRQTASQKVSERKADALSDYIVDNFEDPNACLTWVCKTYKVKILADLTEEQYTDVYNKLRKKVESRGNNGQD